MPSPTNEEDLPVSGLDRRLDDAQRTLLAQALNVSPGAIELAPGSDLPLDLEERLKSGEVRLVQSTPTAAPPATPRPSAYTGQPIRRVLEQRFVQASRQATVLRHHRTKPASSVGCIASSTADAREVVTGAHADGGNVRRAITEFMEYSPRLKKKVLAIRPPGSPSILEELKTPVKLFVSQHQSPGDLIMLTRAVDDLHKSYPGMFITCMRTPTPDIWQHNPHHTVLDDKDPDAMWLACEYKLVNTSNSGSHHFIHGFRYDLQSKLGLPIDQRQGKGAIYIGEQEKTWVSQIKSILGKDVPFWLIDAGRKRDVTCKQWERARYQAVVDALPDITFVQIGTTEEEVEDDDGKGGKTKRTKHKGNIHIPLKGDNVINLLNKTSMRQVIRLMYHAAGVITPVSFPMHLAAAVEVHPRYKRITRPCIVLAGGREPAMWEAYSAHQFLHTCGMLPCCSKGGCWKARVEPLFDGDKKDIANLCERPIVSESGQVVPKCMDMITVDDVVRRVHMYMESYDFSDDDPTKWVAVKPPVPEALAAVRLRASKSFESGTTAEADLTDAATPDPGKDLDDGETLMMEAAR